MPDRTHDDSDVLVIPYIFIPDGAPMPDISQFRDPIIVRAHFEHDRPALVPPAPERPEPRTTSGSFAPIFPRTPAHGDQGPRSSPEPTDPDTLPLLVLSSTGAVLAEGSAAQLSAQAFQIARLMPKNHPVLLAIAGTVLAFATVTALLDFLTPMTGDRNAGLPPALQARSVRARLSAAAAEPEIADRLDPEEWSAHHLIGVRGARRHTQLLTDAAMAGWNMDAPENVMILPRTPAAQEKLARVGIIRPYHNSGHPSWNREVDAGLDAIEEKLRAERLKPGSLASADRTRALLELFQAERRAVALGRRRISRLDTASDHPVKPS